MFDMIAVVFAILIIIGEYYVLKVNRLIHNEIHLDSSASAGDNPEDFDAFGRQHMFVMNFMNTRRKEYRQRARRYFRKHPFGSMGYKGSLCKLYKNAEENLYSDALYEFKKSAPQDARRIKNYGNQYFPHAKSFWMDALGNLQSLFSSLRNQSNPITFSVKMFSHIYKQLSFRTIHEKKSIHLVGDDIFGYEIPTGGSPIFAGLQHACECVTALCLNKTHALLKPILYAIGLAPVIVFVFITDGGDDQLDPNPSKFAIKHSVEDTITAFKNMIASARKACIDLRIILNTTEDGALSLDRFKDLGVTLNILKRGEYNAVTPSHIQPSLTRSVTTSIAKHCGVTLETNVNTISRSLFTRIAIFYRIIRNLLWNAFVSKTTVLKTAFAKIGVSVKNFYNLNECECGICYDKYNKNEVIFSCGHKCCSTCLLQLNNECPFCKIPINATISSIIRSFSLQDKATGVHQDNIPPRGIPQYGFPQRAIAQRGFPQRAIAQREFPQRAIANPFPLLAPLE